MAAPFITFASDTMPADGTSLTTLTGGAGNGFTGADYARQWGAGSYDAKYDGGFQLAMTLFGSTLPTIGSYGWPVTYTMTDRVVNDSSDDSTITTVSPTDSKSWNFGTETANGLEWSLICDQGLRVFHWFGFADGGGYDLSMTFTDSSASGSAALVIGSDSSFKVSYRSTTAGAATLRITKTGGTAGSVNPRFWYIEPPIPATVPQGRNRMRKSFR
jgi:hypothetical protein